MESSMMASIALAVLAAAIYLLKAVADREQDELLGGIASLIVRLGCRILPPRIRSDRLPEYLGHLAEHQKEHDVPGVVFSVSVLWVCAREAPGEWGETLWKSPFGLPAQGILVLTAALAIYIQAVVMRSEESPGRPSGEIVSVGEIRIDQSIAANLQRLLGAARSDGIELSGAGYRDPQDQVRLRMAHCGTSPYAIYEMPASACSPPTSRPGMSMHEVGLAIDFLCGNGAVTRDSPCYEWLAANAAAYGFYELSTGVEPWHWSVDGS